MKTASDQEDYASTRKQQTQVSRPAEYPRSRILRLAILKTENNLSLFINLFLLRFVYNKFS